MVTTAIVLLSIAVALGAYLLSFVLRKKNPPKAIAIAHGAFAVLGILILLSYALTTEEHHKHWESLVLFALAAIVGLYLFSRDIRHKQVPGWLAALHGVVGAGGLVWLLIHVLH